MEYGAGSLSIIWKSQSILGLLNNCQKKYIWLVGNYLIILSKYLIFAVRNLDNAVVFHE